MIVLVGAATTLKTLNTPDRQEFWSPYYRISYGPNEKEITVNLLGHQKMYSRELPMADYALPHLFNRDAGGKSFDDGEGPIGAAVLDHEHFGGGAASGNKTIDAR